MIINNVNKKLSKEELITFLPIDIPEYPELKIRYSSSKELGLIYDIKKKLLVNYRINEYGTGIIWLNNKKFNLSYIIASQYLPKPSKDLNYATRINKDILDFSIKNLIWKKKPNSKFNKDYFLKLAKETHGSKFSFSKIGEGDITSRKDNVTITCPDHGDFVTSIETFLRSNFGGCKKCINEYYKNKYTEEVVCILDENKVQSVREFKEKFPDIYNKVKGVGLSIYEIFYNIKIDSLEDIQGFINRFNIQNSSELRKEYPGVFYLAEKKKYLSSLIYPNPLYILRGLHKMSVDEIKQYLTSNNIHSIYEFSKFDPSLYSVSNRRGITSLLGLKKSKSLMEILVSKRLNMEGIIFEEQKTFSWLVYKKNMYLDIFIPSKNLSIELHGSIHYINNNFYKTESDFLDMKKRDKTKFELCKKNNITVIYFTSKFTKHFEDIPSEVFNEGNYFNKIYTDLDELITFIKNF